MELKIEPYQCRVCVETRQEPVYCARCYCGHPECPAYDTYRELPKPQNIFYKNNTSRSSWDDREEQTWLDKM